MEAASGDVLIRCVVLGFLIVLSALFSGAETALTALGRHRASLLASKGVRGMRLWLEEPNRLLATILVANNFVNVGASALVTTVAMGFLPHTTAGAVAAVATFFATLLILVFGEITPKMFARQHAERISRLLAPPLEVLSTILLPLVRVLTALSNAFIRLFGGKVYKSVPFLTEEELKEIITVGEHEGVLEEEEREMIHSIFEFGETKVSEIMVPRIEMVCVDVEMPFREALGVVIEAGHSRVPVYEGSIDNIVGVLYAKDMLAALASVTPPPSIREIMRAPVFVPEGKLVSDLLSELRRQKVHIAIVVDEYGGTAGLVTIEDLIEEIVGEIEDEFDEAKEEGLTFVGDGVVIASGRADLDELEEEFGVSLASEGEAETVAGFVLNRLGRVPAEGETFEAGGVRVTVLEADRRHVIRVKLEKLEGTGEESKG